MIHINLKGSYYEMGFEYGKKLRTAGFKLPVFSDKDLKFGDECKAHVEAIFPEFLEELHGMADAAGLKRSELYAFTLKIPTAECIHGCSTFAVTDGTQTFFGRNYDMYYSFKEHLESTFAVPSGGFRSVGHSDIFVGREDGMNEKGLTVAQSGIVSYVQPGLCFWVSIRYLLDKCRTVQECIDFLIDIPHYSTMMFLLANPTGEMAVVEASPTRTAVR
ncbi:MAG: C45 family autoproteolytic acyltransferase/hydrolase, partial [Candidatus Hodarchaeota archaeon]